MWGAFRSSPTQRASKKLKPGWVDAPDALRTLDGLSLFEWQAKGLRELIVDGFTVLPSMIAPNLCDRVVRDYEQWAKEKADYVSQNLDELGREKRLVNFHLASEAAMAVATDQHVMELLDLFFGQRSSVYTSLTFKYGTQQPIHRDTPHFATWPPNRFCGVWTALEDVDEDAGPLMYIRGGHRFDVDEHNIFHEVESSRGDLDAEQHAGQALDVYNGVIMQTAPENGDFAIAPIRKGDVAIWHPQLPHGGSPANDPQKTRLSMVVHCAPEDVQVHQHDRFFTHKGPEAPPARYGLFDSFERKVAASGETAFM